MPTAASKSKAKSKPLRVGVLGLGAVADWFHLPHWRELEEEGRVVLAAGSDLRPEACESMAEKYSIPKTYLDYREMLRKEQLDIVDVCVHNRLHCQTTVDALKAGAHTLVEKPMAMSVKESLRMIQAAEAANRKLMVAQHLRFENGARKVKRMVESGELGEVYTAKATWLRRRGIPGWGKFVHAEESLGGPLADIGVHVMDLCVWLMGSPRAVAVSGMVYRKFGDRPDLVNNMPLLYKRDTFDVEDHAVAMVRFEEGQTMLVQASWAANIADDHLDVEIMGDKGGAGVFPPRFHGYDEDSLFTRKIDWSPERKGHREEIRHFVECIEQDKPVMVVPEESLQIQKIINGIYESARKGREIALK